MVSGDMLTPVKRRIVVEEHRNRARVRDRGVVRNQRRQQSRAHDRTTACAREPRPPRPAAARRTAPIVARVDSRPTPTIKVRSRGTSARAASTTASPSSSSSSAASPLVPSATMPPRPAAIQCVTLARMAAAIDLAVANGVGIGGNTARRFTGETYHRRPRGRHARRRGWSDTAGRARAVDGAGTKNGRGLVSRARAGCYDEQRITYDERPTPFSGCARPRPRAAASSPRRGWSTAPGRDTRRCGGTTCAGCLPASRRSSAARRCRDR